MKKFYNTFLMLIAVFLLQGCSKSFNKTYEIKFDKLLMYAFEQNFNTPSSLRDCRMEIKTDEEYDITQYCDGSWMFQSHWGFGQSDEENGFFYVPNMENCDITLCNNTTNAKYLELSCRDGKIISLTVYDGYNNVTCEVRGVIECDFMFDEASSYYFSFGHRAFYDDSNEGKRYKSKEETTKLYEETGDYKIYKLTNVEYYPSGDISHITSHICITAMGDAESYSHIIEDSYFEEPISSEDVIQMDNESYENTPKSSAKAQIKHDESNKPSWLIASWRTPLDGDGVLIVNLYPNDADVKIMHGFRLVSKIEYDNWTVWDNMLYLINDGERVSDSPSFYVDFRNRSIIGHNGESFEKH